MFISLRLCTFLFIAIFSVVVFSDLIVGIALLPPFTISKNKPKRGFKGLKIHLVALSWVFITVFLPLSLEGKPIKYISLVYGLQRYFFVIAATLPFLK